MFKKLLLFLGLFAAPLSAGFLEQKAYNAGVVIFSSLAPGKIEPTCSGAVVEKKENIYTILTAAHCVATENDFGMIVLRPNKIYVGSSISKGDLSEAKVL